MVKLRKMLSLAKLDPDPVGEVQRILEQKSKDMDVDVFTHAFDEMMQKGLWREKRSSEGTEFKNFGEFAVALPPFGLGARTERMFLMLRGPLIAAGYLEVFTSYLERVARERGRPRKNLVNNEDFPRFRRVSTALTSLERTLLALKRSHAESFAQVCAHDLSPRLAALKVGIAPTNKVRPNFGVCNFAAVSLLSAKKQGKLICRLFGRL